MVKVLAKSTPKYSDWIACAFLLNHFTKHNIKTVSGCLKRTSNCVVYRIKFMWKWNWCAQDEEMMSNGWILPPEMTSTWKWTYNSTHKTFNLMLNVKQNKLVLIFSIEMFSLQIQMLHFVNYDDFSFFVFFFCSSFLVMHEWNHLPVFRQKNTPSHDIFFFSSFVCRTHAFNCRIRMENMQNYGIGCESVTYTTNFLFRSMCGQSDVTKIGKDGKRSAEYRQLNNFAFQN